MGTREDVGGSAGLSLDSRAARRGRGRETRIYLDPPVIQRKPEMPEYPYAVLSGYPTVGPLQHEFISENYKKILSLIFSLL